MAPPEELALLLVRLFLLIVRIRYNLLLLVGTLSVNSELSDVLWVLYDRISFCLSSGRRVLAARIVVLSVYPAWRAGAAQLAIESLLDSFYIRSLPSHLLEFCPISCVKIKHEQVRYDVLTVVHAASDKDLLCAVRYCEVLSAFDWPTSCSIEPLPFPCL